MPPGGPSFAPRRGARLAAFMLAAVALAGCFAAPPPAEAPADRPGAAPVLVCPDPCAQKIDAGERFEPAVAVDPTDPLHLVAASIDTSFDARAGGAGWWPLVHVSFDGGATWETTRLPGGPSESPDHPLFPYTAMGDPVPTFLPDGTLLVAAIADARASPPRVAHAATGDAVVLLRSTDGGRTFPEATIVKEGAGAYLRGPAGANVAMDQQDKEWFALGADGTLVLVWVRMTSDVRDPFLEEVTIVGATSTDGGRTWSDLWTVAQAPRLQGPFPLILDDGTWLVAYVEQSEDQAFVARSHDRGATWEARAVDVSTKFPVLAKGPGPSGERVHLAYPATTEGVESVQATLLRWSDDGGASWSAPLVLDAPQAPGPSLPALAVAPEGTAYITYWHAGEEESELRAVAVRDGIPSARMTLATTDGSPSRTGHYMGIAPLPDGGAYAVWNARGAGQYTLSGARLATL